MAVVAAHDRDAVALVDALVAKRAGERVGALVRLREGERAELVDDRRLVGIVDRARLAEPSAGEAPQRDVGARAIRASLSGRIGRSTPGLDQGAQLEEAVGDRPERNLDAPCQGRLASELSLDPRS